jgi:adenylate cyclase
MILAYSGEPTEAIAVTNQALRQGASPPPGIRQLAGIVFYNARQYERAIEQLKAVLAVWPADATAHEHLAAAYAHLGKLDLARNEAGAIPDYFPMKTSLGLSRLWYERYYKRAEDLAHHLEGLKAAGIPEWPFGFEGRPQDQVSGQALATLTLGRTWSGYEPIHIGENTPIILQFDKENRLAYRSAHTFLSGVVRLENDQLCVQFEGYLPNLWLCGGVYRLDHVGNDGGADYVYAPPDGLKYFSVKN